jgi:hypothetical protein
MSCPYGPAEDLQFRLQRCQCVSAAEAAGKELRYNPGQSFDRAGSTDIFENKFSARTALASTLLGSNSARLRSENSCERRPRSERVAGLRPRSHLERKVSIWRTLIGSEARKCWP